MPNRKRYLFGLLAVYIMLLILPVTDGFAGLNSSSTAYTYNNGKFVIPLKLQDNSGVVRTNWPVTSGVPLPYGLVKDPDHLRLTDINGSDIPCQFGVTSRYWARDSSLKWVLLDFQINIPANGTVYVYLRNDNELREKLPEKTGSIVIEESADKIEICSGPLRASVQKKESSLLQSVSLKGQPILIASPEDGPHVRSGEVDAFEHFQGENWSYNGWPKTKSIEKIHVGEFDYRGEIRQAGDVYVELRGPLRSVIVIRGRYMPTTKGEGRVKDGIYNFTTRLHFFRGHSFVMVEHAIENSDNAQPLWNFLFRESKLLHSLVLEKDTVVTGGGAGAVSTPYEKLIKGTVSLPHDKAGWLYQKPGQMDLKKPGTMVPGVFKVGISSGGTIPIPTVEGQSAKFLDISDGKKGVAVSIRYFEEEAPRAIAMSANRLEIMLNADNPERKVSPESNRPEYDLDFGERILHDVLYYFHEKSAEDAKVQDVAEAFNYPLFAYAPPAWYSDTEAWYFEMSRTPKQIKRKNMGDKHWQPTSIGYKDHGINHGYNAGGHHESLNSGWLGFLKSGDLVELERNLALSRWAIAHNPGWAYRRNRLEFGDESKRYEKIDNELNAWDRMTSFGPKDFFLWRRKEAPIQEKIDGPDSTYFGGETYLNKFKWLPDIEHYALFRLFEYYYLSGDLRALDAIHGFVNWDLNIQHHYLFNRKMPPLSVTDLFEKDPVAMFRGHPNSRVHAWMLYTNLAGFHATGSAVYNEVACWQIRRVLALLRHRHGQLKGWWKEPENIPNSNEPGFFSKTQTWQEAKGVLALHEAYKTYDDERILDGIWGLADYFSHHVVYYPRLGMVNKWTAMPNSYLGDDAVSQEGKTIFPQRHDRHVQMWPVLYHYTGWADVLERYRGFESIRKKSEIQDWFLQTIDWEQENKKKHSVSPPDQIKDLKVIQADRSSGITLTWTSPKDDGPLGRATQYFVKYSSKPIVEFAPTDNPERAAGKKRVVQAIEDHVLNTYTQQNILKTREIRITNNPVPAENRAINRFDPNWHRLDAFWMAEHVAGEPEPQNAGAKEIFTIKQLRPHNWFGCNKLPGLDILKPGTYYIAICTWDEDLNLSLPSNVVQFPLP
jgi:hypothetical protein